MLGGVLSVISVLGLYVEAVVQFCALFNTTVSEDSNSNGLHVSLVVVVALCVSVSLLTTNIASLLLAFRCWKEEEDKLEEEAGEENKDRAKRRKGVCIAAHAFQLGLAWRTYRVLSTQRNQAQLRRLTALRLIHPSLASFLYVIVVSREMVAPGYHHGIATLASVSLVVSVASSSLALACYVLRHQPVMAGWAGTVGAAADGGGGVPVAGGRLRCAGVLALVAGTFLCLAARLGAFALVSAQHGAWILLPLLAHLSIQTTVRFTCSSSHRDGHSAEASDGTVTKSGCEKNHRPTFCDQIHANLEPEVGRTGNCGCGNGCCEADQSRGEGISSLTTADHPYDFSPQADVIRRGSSDVSDHFVTDATSHCHHHHYEDNAFGFPNNNKKPGGAAGTTQDTNTHINIAETNAKSIIHDAVEEPFSSFCSSTITTKRKEEEEKKLRRTLTAIAVFRGLAESYLNTLDLTDSSVSGTRCRHVLYYSLVLLENLAMAAAWMLPSPLGSEARLLLPVGLLAAFLLGLVLKVAACGCLAGGRCAGAGGEDDGDRDEAGVGRHRGSAGQSTSCPGTPRLFVSSHEGDPGGLQLRQHSHRNIRGRHYSSTPSLYKGNREVHHSTPRSRSNASISVGTISSRNKDGGSLGRRTRARPAAQVRRRGSSRSIGDLNNTRTTSPSDYINVRQALEQRSLSRSGSNQASNEERRPTRRENEKANVPRRSSGAPSSKVNEYRLVTEGNHQHLKALIRERADSLDGVWTTSSTGVFSDEQDSCSFDDPIAASQLVIESLCGRGDSRRPSSQRTSSTPSRQRSRQSHGHGTSSSVTETRGSETRKTDLAFIQEGVRSDGETYAGYGGRTVAPLIRRTPRRSALLPRSSSCEVHGDHVLYSYWTRCTCRGSPTSTPRRRPQKQVSPRKARSNCTASRPYRPSTDAAAASAKRNHDHLAHGTCRHRHKKSKTMQSLTDEPHLQQRRHGDDREVEPSVSSTDDDDEEEESKWIDAFKSKCSSTRPPLPLPLAREANDYTRICQSSQTQERLHSHWPWCHHHGNDREECAWPRRSFRAALEGGVVDETSSAALHDDASSVYAQDVVHLWLRSTNAHYENLPCVSLRDTAAVEARGAPASYLHVTRAASAAAEIEDCATEEGTDCSLRVRPGDSDDCGRRGDDYDDDDDDLGDDDEDEVLELMKQQSAWANQYNRSALPSRVPIRTIESRTLAAPRKNANETSAGTTHRDTSLCVVRQSTGLPTGASKFRSPHHRNLLSAENVKRHAETLRQATHSVKSHEAAARDAHLGTRASSSSSSPRHRQRPASPITTIPCDLHQDVDSDVTLSDTRTSDSVPSSEAAAVAVAADDDDSLRTQPAVVSAYLSRSPPRSNSHRRHQVTDSGVSSSTIPDAEGVRPLNGHGQAAAKSSDSDVSRSNAKGYASRPPSSEGSSYSAEARNSVSKAPGSCVTVSKPPLSGSGFLTLKGHEGEGYSDTQQEFKSFHEANHQPGLSIYGEDVTKTFRPDRVFKLDVHESLV